MEQHTLHYITREPNFQDTNTRLLIMLHGYGSHEEDLFSFAPQLPENLIIVSARAPYETGFGGFAWYSINFTPDQSRFTDLPQARKSVSSVAQFLLDMQKRYQIAPQNTLLMGFSQGAILSYAIAMQFPDRVQKIMALSGYINPDLFPEKLDPENYAQLDLFISHGSVDQVIPVEWARQGPPILDELGIKYVYKEYPVGHGVAPQNFFDMKDWLTARI